MGSSAARLRPSVKRVLVLSYYFPPLGGVGAQRPLKFVKHLPEWGYEAIVVTGPDTAEVAWAPKDAVLDAEIPANVPVHRAAGPHPVPSGSRHRLARWSGSWSPFHRWWQDEAMRVGLEAARDVDVVYTMMSPFSSAGAAAAVARSAGTPWVADLQDPWALDEWTVYPTALHRRLDLRRMRRDLRSAAAIVTTAHEPARVLREQFPDLAAVIATIPWGWDRDDFVGAVPSRADGAFRIVYAGYTHLDRGRRHRARRPFRRMLGGAVKGLDILPRSHLYLMEAIERVGRLDPALARRTELHIAGPAPVGDHALGGAGAILRSYGYLPHDRAVALMRSADVLFLPMHDLPPGTRAHTIPGKTYEYLASGRPILAALPDGDARDLLGTAADVWLCRPVDVEGMAAALVEIAHARLHVGGRAELAARFEWRELSRQLAGLFDEIVGAG